MGEEEIRLSRDRTYEILDAWQPREFSPRADSHFSCTDSFVHARSRIRRDSTKADTSVQRNREVPLLSRRRFHDVEPVSRQSLIVFRPIGQSVWVCFTLTLSSIAQKARLSFNNCFVSFKESWPSLARDETPWNIPVFISALVRHPASVPLDEPYE